MDEQQFKRHLRDLAHGHHHPEEHDWEPQPEGQAVQSEASEPVKRKTTKSAARKPQKRK